ncbi:class I SAM-dependent methyltransferase [Texcoconibacillus texcoconensis]|uniref:SAM-dependent MidA family methyltransferase n=1 Tax=Texcoconibacillus texcoconensis TaxID=1095777 RepID=A0A840QP17_9BACI|nr:SAM-dependent methyltransferase [Texcoconibacillus texcoconensis]MBB5173114.1 SAM-dependent MidA family methyltransferase [Texcoconibacillus texcoconensis]
MKRLIERIEQAGILDIASYMEHVLYDEVEGYYMKKNKKLGKEGDYYTSNHVHPVFAKTFAHFFHDVLTKERLPLMICECGGGDGKFAKSVLDEWKQTFPSTYQLLDYRLVETSPFHRSLQEEALDEHQQVVTLHSSLEEVKGDVPDFQGVIFSNELLDALPVRVVEVENSELYEIFVALSEEGELIEERQRCEDQDIQSWIEQYGPTLDDGQRIEIPLAMKDWQREVSEWLKNGMIVTVDYGYTNDDWRDPQLRDGSLRGYSNHRMVKNPLKFPGEMDLTSHVHWDTYDKIMKEFGLKRMIAERQDRFLIEAGLLQFAQETTDPNPFSKTHKKNRAIQQLVHPTGISGSFSVYVHERGLSECDSYQYFCKSPYIK